MRLGIFFVTCLTIATLFVSGGVFAQTDLRGQIDSQVNAAVDKAGLVENRDPREVVASVIKIILTMLGTFFLVLVVMSGYWYLTAAGDEEKITKAKNTIQAAVIGLTIILVSYSIVLFVGARIGGAILQGGKAPR